MVSSDIFDIVPKEYPEVGTVSYPNRVTSRVNPLLPEEKQGVIKESRYSSHLSTLVSCCQSVANSLETMEGIDAMDDFYPPYLDPMDIMDPDIGNRRCELPTSNQQVGGSSPSGCTSKSGDLLS